MNSGIDAKPLAADIETCGVEELHARPDFFRLGGLTDEAGEMHITDDAREYIHWLEMAPALAMHNGLTFDLLALARQHGADYEALCAKTVDSLIVERHVNPVAAKGVEKTGYRGLDQTAARYGASGKTDDLAKLARKHGGYGEIPTDDPEYRSYLEGDLTAQDGLTAAHARLDISPDDQAYIRREHAVATMMGRITLNGFRVDVEENERRYEAGQARLEAGRILLHEKYGMPLEGKKPHTTNLGKAAFRAALVDTGIRPEVLDAEWPLNKDGSLSLSKDVLAGFSEMLKERNPAAAQLCDTIRQLNGERTVYGTIRDHTHDGRVHPYIGPDQGSGRWSMKDPGLTVLGKRGGKHVERGVLLADEGDVLVAIDADQVDARAVAAMCQDPAYMALFLPGRDLHSEVAALVFGCQLVDGKVKPEDKHYREKCKVFGHGFSYGLGAPSMASQHGVPIEIAQHFVRQFTEAFPILAEWKAQSRAAAGALDYREEPPEGDTYRILHNLYGRPVRVERTRAYTQATAMLGQGSTRDIMAEAMLKLPFAVRSRIKAVVHDEIVLSIPAEGAQETGQLIADSMAFTLRGVDITFGCSKTGPSWADCY